MPPASYEIVDHDPPGCHPVETSEGLHDAIVGQVMEEEHASDVVERTIRKRDLVHITAHQAQGIRLPMRVTPPGARECARTDIECRDPDVEAARLTPSDQGLAEIPATRRHIKNLDTLARLPPSTELREALQRGACAAEPPVDRTEEPVDLVDDGRWGRVVVHVFVIEGPAFHQHALPAVASRPDTPTQPGVLRKSCLFRRMLVSNPGTTTSDLRVDSRPDEWLDDSGHAPEDP